MEVSLLRSGVLQDSAALPIGTVRLMENFGIQGGLSQQQLETMENCIISLLRRYLPRRTGLHGALAVACGGNAEALALIAPGALRANFRTLDLRTLRRKVAQIASMDVPERMRSFRVRQDRAEVMGIGAVVLSVVGRWWDLDGFLVPAVGVKEGLIRDQLRTLYEDETDSVDVAQRQALLCSARRYASMLNYDARHSERVRQLAASLFDQLQLLHGMGAPMRLTLELGAILHDIGTIIRPGLHNKHGEYLIRHGNIAGLDRRRRDMVACLVRCHSEPEPDTDHKLFESFRPAEQRQISILVSLLQIADGLDWDHRQAVLKVRAKLNGKTASFGLRMDRASDLILWASRQRMKPFEVLFGLKANFTTIQ